jgi:hypothetical protein
MKDKHFNESTTEILNEINNFTVKQSNYNSNNYLIECHICKSKDKLETHHIKFQKDFNENLINEESFHYKKDAEYNLVTLCSKCHDDVDRNKIIINGWNETSNGRELDFKLNNILTTKKKYNNDFIEFIKSLNIETKDPKFARIIIKEKFDKKISIKTINELWKSNK